MFVFLCLAAAAAAAAQASPVAKIIPLFEDTAGLRLASDPRLALRTLCTDDCHHHVLQKPVFVVRSLPGAHTIHFAPAGLNGLAKSPLTTPLHDAILSPETNVMAIFPFARFPFELFPGLVDADMVIPEHVTKLRNVYKEAPVVVVFPQEEFAKINERRGLIQVADLAADATGFTIAKDLALLNRNAVLGAPLAAPAPISGITPVPHGGVAPVASFAPPAAKATVIPITAGFTPFTGVAGEPLKFIPNAPATTSYYTTIPIY